MPYLYPWACGDIFQGFIVISGAKVDQLPVLEGKRMTIQLSPKKKESATKKPATPKPATPAAVKVEKPAGDNEE